MWDVALAEMARQSSVVCHERGLLLERARTRTMLGVAFLHRLIGALLSLLNKSETVAVEVVSRVEELTKEAVAAATRPVGDDEADVASKTAQDLLRDHQSDVVRSKREMDGLKSQLSKLVDECNGLEKSHSHSRVQFETWKSNYEALFTGHGANGQPGAFAPKAQIQPMLAAMAGASKTKDMRKKLLSQILTAEDGDIVAASGSFARFDALVKDLSGEGRRINSPVSSPSSSSGKMVGSGRLWGDDDRSGNMWAQLFSKFNSDPNHQTALASVNAVVHIRVAAFEARRRAELHERQLKQLKLDRGPAGKALMRADVAAFDQQSRGHGDTGSVGGQVESVDSSDLWAGTDSDAGSIRTSFTGNGRGGATGVPSGAMSVSVVPRGHITPANPNAQVHNLLSAMKQDRSDARQLEVRSTVFHGIAACILYGVCVGVTHVAV